MVHILLLILKIIGIILLAVLGLVLLLLFFPITYVGKIEVNEKNISYRIRVGWLFHLLHVGVKGTNADYRGAIRIFGIPLKGLKNSGDKEKKKKSKKSTKKNHKEEQSLIKESDDGLKESKEDHSPKDPVEQTSLNENIISENEEKTNKDSKIKIFFNKIKEFFIKIKDQIKEITQKAEGIGNKLIELKNFITAKTTKRAYNYGKKMVFKLLRHLKPRRIKADVTFGLEQPDATGKMLGYIAVAFSTLRINPKRIQISPDFEQKIIKGHAVIKGHLILGIVLLYCLKFYFNKDIHRIIKKYK